MFPGIISRRPTSAPRMQVLAEGEVPVPLKDSLPLSGRPDSTGSNGNRNKPTKIVKLSSPAASGKNGVVSGSFNASSGISKQSTASTSQHNPIIPLKTGTSPSSSSTAKQGIKGAGNGAAAAMKYTPSGGKGTSTRGAQKTPPDIASGGRTSGNRKGSTTNSTSSRPPSNKNVSMLAGATPGGSNASGRLQPDGMKSKGKITAPQNAAKNAMQSDKVAGGTAKLPSPTSTQAANALIEGLLSGKYDPGGGGEEDKGSLALALWNGEGKDEIDDRELERMSLQLQWTSNPEDPDGPYEATLPEAQSSMELVSSLLHKHEKSQRDRIAELQNYMHDLMQQHTLPSAFEDVADVAADSGHGKESVLPTFLTRCLEEEDEEWDGKDGQLVSQAGQSPSKSGKSKPRPRITFVSGNYTPEECILIEEGLNQIARLDDILKNMEQKEQKVKSELEATRKQWEDRSVEKNASQARKEQLHALVEKGLLAADHADLGTANTAGQQKALKSSTAGSHSSTSLAKRNDWMSSSSAQSEQNSNTSEIDFPLEQGTNVNWDRWNSTSSLIPAYNNSGNYSQMSVSIMSSVSLEQHADGFETPPVIGDRGGGEQEKNALKHQVQLVRSGNLVKKKEEDHANVDHDEDYLNRSSASASSAPSTGLPSSSSISTRQPSKDSASSASASATASSSNRSSAHGAQRRNAAASAQSQQKQPQATAFSKVAAGKQMNKDGNKGKGQRDRSSSGSTNAAQKPSNKGGKGSGRSATSNAESNQLALYTADQEDLLESVLQGKPMVTNGEDARASEAPDSTAPEEADGSVSPIRRKEPAQLYAKEDLAALADIDARLQQLSIASEGSHSGANELGVVGGETSGAMKAITEGGGKSSAFADDNFAGRADELLQQVAQLRDIDKFAARLPQFDDDDGAADESYSNTDVLSSSSSSTTRIGSKSRPRKDSFEEDISSVPISQLFARRRSRTASWNESEDELFTSKRSGSISGAPLPRAGLGSSLGDQQQHHLLEEDSRDVTMRMPPVEEDFDVDQDVFATSSDRYPSSRREVDLHGDHMSQHHGSNYEKDSAYGAAPSGSSATASSPNTSPSKPRKRASQKVDHIEDIEDEIARVRGLLAQSAAQEAVPTGKVAISQSSKEEFLEEKLRAMGLLSADEGLG
ncbi:unnamed protein product [Amoebophrya sp. A120]|nr:unnamed protein product [Amoebophrya sp. A120]|eukprot:GSA120T00010383001.1